MTTTKKTKSGTTKRRATSTSTKNKPQAAAPKRSTRRVAEPSHDEIEARAYQLFEQSGYQHGHQLEHWLQAEAELAIPARKR